MKAARTHASGCLTLIPFLMALLPLSLTAQQGEAGARDHNWDFGVWVAGATGEENTNSLRESQLLTGGIFVGRMLTDEIGRGWRRGRFEYGFDIAPLFEQFAPQRIHGQAFDPVILRWHPSVIRRRFAPFIELGGGGVHTSANFPVGDTSDFNFIARGGGGVQISMLKRQALEIACRWWHISNANLGARNPEFNGIQMSVGWHWLK